MEVIAIYPIPPVIINNGIIIINKDNNTIITTTVEIAMLRGIIRIQLNKAIEVISREITLLGTMQITTTTTTIIITMTRVREIIRIITTTTRRCHTNKRPNLSNM